jgi:hypothetical protein
LVFAFSLLFFQGRISQTLGTPPRTCSSGIPSLQEFPLLEFLQDFVLTSQKTNHTLSGFRITVSGPLDPSIQGFNRSGIKNILKKISVCSEHVQVFFFLAIIP